jgi:hypothetical protein
MAKLKTPRWDDLSRHQKLGSVLYPHLASEDLRNEMASIASGEGRKAPTQQALLSNAERGSCSPLGGQAKRK